MKERELAEKIYNNQKEATGECALSLRWLEELFCDYGKQRASSLESELSQVKEERDKLKEENQQRRESNHNWAVKCGLLVTQRNEAIEEIKKLPNYYGQIQLVRVLSILSPKEKDAEKLG